MNSRSLVFANIVLTLVCISVSGQTTCFDGDSYKLTEAGKKAFESLKNETTFALGGIGYGGEMSEGEEAMRVLLAEAHGSMALYQLATTDAGAGGLYGMFGLRVIKSDCFSSAYKAFGELPDKGETSGRHEKLGASEVGHMSGCLYYVRKRKDIAGDIFRGKLDPWIKTINRRIDVKTQ